MKQGAPTEDFLIRPWKPRGGDREKKKKRKVSVSWTGEQSFIWGITGHIHIIYMHSCHGDILRERLLLTGASLFLGFPRDQSLFSERRVWMKCAGAGRNMSNGRFCHLLRGAWLLWQGEFSHCLQDGSVDYTCLNNFLNADGLVMSFIPPSHRFLSSELKI